MAHAYNPSRREMEAGGSRISFRMRLQTAWLFKILSHHAIRVSEMAEKVRHLSPDPGLIPRSHLIEEQSDSCKLFSDLYACAELRTSTHIHKEVNKN